MNIPEQLRNLLVLIVLLSAGCSDKGCDHACQPPKLSMEERVTELEQQVKELTEEVNTIHHNTVMYDGDPYQATLVLQVPLNDIVTQLVEHDHLKITHVPATNTPDKYKLEEQPIYSPLTGEECIRADSGATSCVLDGMPKKKAK